MGWSCQIDLLPNQNIQFRDRALKTFELRQVRMKIEGIDATQEVKTIECALGLDRRR